MDKITKQQRNRKTVHKYYNEYKVDVTKFFIPDKYAAYLLGFIWGDGHISLRQIKNRKTSSVMVNGVNSDITEILPIFETTGEWNIYNIKTKGNRQPQIRLTAFNRVFTEFLADNDYVNKSYNQNKILKIIPENLHNYFLLGLIDADGCFYKHDKSPSKSFTITSTKEQDWSSIENIFNNLHISYKIWLDIRSKGNSSSIKITNIDGLTKLKNYIYPNGFEFGLKRKFINCNKCCNII